MILIVYKITNTVNGKVYIGQTRFTLEHRKRGHIECALSGVDRHLYNAMRKYGTDKFVFETLATADSLDELNYLEASYIIKYDSVRNGYNMGYGGANNVMSSEIVKRKHDEKMRTNEVRTKISESLKAYRRQNPFTDEHKRKLSEKAMGNHNFGNSDTRSVECYCIDEHNNIHNFHNYLQAGKWWFDNYKPFPYSACVYQRKIKQSIAEGFCTYGREHTKFEYPRWYLGKVGDVNETVTD